MYLTHLQTPHPTSAPGALIVTEAQFLALAKAAGIDERTQRCILAVMRLGDRRHVIGGTMYQLAADGEELP